MARASKTGQHGNLHTMCWIKKGLLLHQHLQVRVLQISCAIARNGWPKDIKRRDDVGQFSSTHLHSVFFNAQVCQTVCLTGESRHLFPYSFMLLGHMFGREDSLECCELTLLSVAIQFPSVYDSQRSIGLHVSLCLRQLDLGDSQAWRTPPPPPPEIFRRKEAVHALHHCTSAACPAIWRCPTFHQWCVAGVWQCLEVEVGRVAGVLQAQAPGCADIGFTAQLLKSLPCILSPMVHTPWSKRLTYLDVCSLDLIFVPSLLNLWPVSPHMMMMMVLSINILSCVCTVFFGRSQEKQPSHGRLGASW